MKEEDHTQIENTAAQCQGTLFSSLMNLQESITDVIEKHLVYNPCKLYTVMYSILYTTVFVSMSFYRNKLLILADMRVCLLTVYSWYLILHYRALPWMLHPNSNLLDPMRWWSPVEEPHKTLWCHRLLWRYVFTAPVPGELDLLTVLVCMSTHVSGYWHIAIALGCIAPTVSINTLRTHRIVQ